MNPDDRLLNGCMMAFEEALRVVNYPAHTIRARRAGIIAVLKYLATETSLQKNEPPSLSAKTDY
jgi:hypothetical protein